MPGTAQAGPGPDRIRPVTFVKRIVNGAKWRIGQYLKVHHPNVAAAVDLEARTRRRRVVQYRSRRPPRGVLTPDVVPTAADVQIARRILEAHRATLAAAPLNDVAQVDIWTLIGEEQRDFSALLALEDPEQLAVYLCNVSRHSAAIGIAQGHHEYARFQRDRVYRDFLVRMAHDKLVLLAEAVGAVAPDNPEQGEFGLSARYLPEELVERIEERLGFEIVPPNVEGAVLKLSTNRGSFGERDLNAVYTAHLLAQRPRGEPAPSVCEIGGGMGRVAYWARRMGIRSYTIIDLPLVNVVQGFYALKTMGSEEVVLYGERPPGDAEGRLQILPSHAVEELGDTCFDIVLNQDSMPEMSAEIAEAYLSWIAKACRGRFMSINHESKPPYGDGLVHLNVSEMAQRVDGLQRDARFQYWLRRGYVVETYSTEASC